MNKHYPSKLFSAEQGSTNRRRFLHGATVGLALGGCDFLIGEQPTANDEAALNMIGPRAGYSPQIGTLVSMLTNMRAQVISTVETLKQPDLDFLFDSKANTIGALLLHLAATDRYYHLHTFGEKAWGSWDEAIKKEWDIPMELGEPARRAIKGHDVKYYLDILAETRDKTFAEFRKRDVKWLLSRDKVSPNWGNYYSQWFHVCEHESNHRGQIKFIAVRLPGAKPETGG